MILLFDWKKEKKQSLTEIWPKDENGDNEEAVFLCHLQCNDMSDDLLVNMLEAYGIPCVKRYPGDGGFGKVIMGMSGLGTDLYVPKSMYADAFELYNREETDDDGIPEGV